MKIAVCGGAGYIGSHTVIQLLAQGHTVTVIDNLETGFPQAVSPEAELVTGDLRDMDFIAKALKGKAIEAVIDFAAYSLVGESVTQPLKYYRNNLTGAMNLLDAMQQNSIPYIVFSSTAAVYGEAKNIPILETDPTMPTNPYGETKLSVEKMLHWFSNAYGLTFAALRYFNVAGAHPNGNIGEAHNPESHIIPNILKVAMGQRDAFTLFGNDYATKDGTCVRDYIHVLDLADAHILALNHIVKTKNNETYNLGNGQGFSNKEILDMAIKVTGCNIPFTYGPRRAGDPPTLIASSDKIMEQLHWQPNHPSLETIVETAWRWHCTHPNGYN